MKLKILPKQIYLIIVLTSFVFFLMFLFYFLFKSPIQNDSSLLVGNVISVPQQEQINFGLPVRIKIPQINIDASIETVGLTSSGAVDVPKGPTNTAWFNLWPRPGEIGNSIITGHSGWKNGIPAVFDNLYKLRKGDRLYITDDKGIIISFVVRKIQKYNPNDSVPDVFIPSDEKAHLNLITCTGIWNKINKSHSNRLVIFTDKE
ncbi:MAG: class F sortase [Candidatus Paceibacterota bacterium]|jgi:LPXTG-site transpeptidase (sortase) family protein